MRGDRIRCSELSSKQGPFVHFQSLYFLPLWPRAGHINPLKSMFLFLTKDEPTYEKCNCENPKRGRTFRDFACLLDHHIPPSVCCSIPFQSRSQVGENSNRVRHCTGCSETSLIWSHSPATVIAFVIDAGWSLLLIPWWSSSVDGWAVDSL